MAAESERYERDNNLTTLSGTTSFSHLLFADDDSLGDLDMNQIFNCSTSSSNSDKKPRMLCFGDYPHKAENILFSKTKRTSQKSALTCSDSSSSASSANSVLTTMSKSISNRKRNGSGQEPVHCMNTNQRSSKKTKTENPISNAPPKRKEKLGERIAALQQLVSPFGKTDTASVLHEAMGYIRFLQEQVQVLSSPYLHQYRSSSSLLGIEEGENGEKLGGKKDLRSSGLCLVPVECTVHVANTNGADFWAPAVASSVSPATKQ